MDRVSRQRSTRRRRRSGPVLYNTRNNDNKKLYHRANRRFLRILVIRYPLAIYPYAHMGQARWVERVHHFPWDGHAVVSHPRSTRVDERYIPATSTFSRAIFRALRPFKYRLPGRRLIQAPGNASYVRTTPMRVDDPWVSPLLRLNDSFFRGQGRVFFLRRLFFWWLLFASLATRFVQWGGAVGEFLRAWVASWGFGLICDCGSVPFRAFTKGWASGANLVCGLVLWR